MPDPTNLIERIERADASEQWELLDEAWIAAHGPKPPRVHGGSRELSDWLARYSPFLSKLDAEAYVDAALMLVPAECVWTVMTDYGLPGRARVHNVPYFTTTADAATPALAIAAAALKARSQP